MNKFTQQDFELKSKRLNLRPLKESDAESMWPYSSNFEFPKFMSWNAHTDINQTKSYLRETEQGKELIWAIFQNSNFCGVVGYHDFQWTIGACETGGVAELGYWLIPSLWGNGLMPEAAQAILEFGFYKIKLHKVKTGHISQNKQSKRVIEKLGFRFIGEELDRWEKNGIWYDHMNYEMLRREYFDLYDTSNNLI